MKSDQNIIIRCKMKLIEARSVSLGVRHYSFLSDPDEKCKDNGPIVICCETLNRELQTGDYYSMFISEFSEVDHR
jgi:hypothetical protein